MLALTLCVARAVDGSTTLAKGVARNGFVSAGAYRYYKTRVACAEAAAAVTFELATSNGNADLYVSASQQPSSSSYDYASVNGGNGVDSVTIASPTNGYYYVSVLGTLSSTYRLRVTTTMFTGKHACAGFRIVDSDVSSVGSGSGNQFVLQEALTASAAAGFAADVSVDGDVILGDAYADSVTVKGETKLGVTDGTYYAISRQPPSSPGSDAGGALSIIGANSTSGGGSVKILGGTGGGAAGGDVIVEAGSGAAGNGGALYLRGGTSNSGTGGDVVIDAGDSTTQASSYEGVIHIGPNSASFVRVGESANKQVKTDIFGDLTVHGNLLTTNDVVYASTYTSYVQVSTSQDGMFQQEVRVPKITGLDAEDISGTPTSTLTLDAGMRGSEQHVVIAPSVATAVYIGSSSTAVPVSIRQGANAGDARFNADGNGAVSVTSASGQDLTVASGDDVVVSTAASKTLVLKQGSTDILSWDAAGAVTLNSTLGVTGATTLSSTLAVTSTSTLTGDVTMSGAATVGTTLGVTGATTLASLGVTGATTLGSTLDVTGAITMPTTHGAKLNLYGTAGGLGVQFYGVYVRTAGNFAVHEGGTHDDTELSAGTGGALRMVIQKTTGNVGINVANPQYTLHVDGTGHFTGALSKGSGSFMIDHPLPEMKDTHNLYHSFIEGPRADLIYRGKVRLTNGRAVVDLDAVSDMTSGTFVALNRDVQCFTSNESDWDAVRGTVDGATLTIESQNSSSTALVSWMVIGERHDQHMYDTDWTDENGRVVPERLKTSATT